MLMNLLGSANKLERDKIDIGKHKHMYTHIQKPLIFSLHIGKNRILTSMTLKWTPASTLYLLGESPLLYPITSCFH